MQHGTQEMGRENFAERICTAGVWQGGGGHGQHACFQAGTLNTYAPKRCQQQTLMAAYVPQTVEQPGLMQGAQRHDHTEQSTTPAPCKKP